MSVMQTLKIHMANSAEERLAYYCCLLLVIFSTVTSILDQKISEALGYLAALLLVYGFLVFLSQLLSNLASSTPTKFIGSGIIVGCSAATFAFAGQVVNTSLEVPSSAFIYTQTVVAVLAAPFAIAFVVLLFSLIFLPLIIAAASSNSSEISLKNSLDPKKSSGKLIFCFRFLGFITVIVLCSKFLSSNQWYTEPVTDFTKWFAYHLETEQFSHCNVGEKQRVAYLADSKIILAEQVDGTYSFKLGICEDAL